MAGVLDFAAARGLLRRYARFTYPSSNAPRGRRTDWRGFFGRR